MKKNTFNKVLDKLPSNKIILALIVAIILAVLLYSVILILTSR